jgi:multiple sugar transport system substrate-binding protein
MSETKETFMTRNTRNRRWTAAAAAAASIALLAGCSAAAPAAEQDAEPDSGAVMTMWARNTSNNIAEVIVDTYNASHQNQIELTIVPNEAYPQKVAAAAASGGLPDLLASDVVYSPNYVKQGLLQDITERMEALPFHDSLAPAHGEAASMDGATYGAPFIVDSSLILYNKTLFAEAGLDPEKGPTDYDEIYEYAKAVQDLDKPDTYGFYFGGNCPGCNAYTLFGNLAAAGEEPLLDDGAKANVDTDAMKETLDLYKRLWDDGLVAPSAETEDGVNWNTLFNEGKIGILPRGTGNFANLANASFDWGVASLPAPDGSATSGFIGGDVLGITSSSEYADQAWNFIEWTLSEENQVDVVAKAGSLPSRIDLAENEYSAADPRIVQAIKGEETGYTPATPAYATAINNPNGPWLAMIRAYVFEGDANALEDGQKAIQKAIDEAQ